MACAFQWPVWVEVLAQRQGLNYESSKNWSYYGHYSANLVTNVNSFAAPTNANTFVHCLG